ncbi:MAG: chitobiase/beta-hexosaminidase C-terminal domain-containing protein [Reichenbachiella sp.]|uniref:chitobiase/beta-hexosaminidase C-terminal domain-containing protein n=1 Tax=Reichenbachiella sp. TaxID=2184521 RepID=UPI003263F664
MRKALLFLILCPLAAYSQQKPNVQKQYYISEDGKLYWHGKNPMYLFVSETPDGKNLHKLNSEIHKDYTNPMYLDTEGINYIRSNWAADSSLKQLQPKFELLFEVYRDSEAPKTTVLLDESPKYKNTEGKQYFGKGLKFKSTAVDNQSGVQKTFYSVDNNNFLAFTKDQELNQDKEYDIKIYSADNTGNVEPIQIFQFRVDLTTPVSEYTVHNDRSGMIFSPRTYIKLQSVDATSGLNRIGYKIDNGAEKIFSNQIDLNALEDGPHTINFYGYDNVKNKEVDKVIEFYLDKTVPVVEATIVGDQYQNRGRVFVSTRTKVKLTAEDNKAGVKIIKYSIDGADPETYYEPFIMDKTGGNHVITYYAVDKVNNRFDGKLEESNLSRSSLDIDMEAPEIKYEFTGDQYHSRDTAFVTGNSEIALAAIDGESGVKDLGYKINGGTGQTYDGPIKLEEEGFYTIDFYGTDQVNNRNTKSFFFVVDNTGPRIEHILSMEPVGKIILDEKDGNPVSVYSKGVKLFLAATDKTVDTDKVYYTLNGEAELEYVKPVKINTRGLVTYQVRAVDKLGNVTTSEEVEVFIK